MSFDLISFALGVGTGVVLFGALTISALCIIIRKADEYNEHN